MFPTFPIVQTERFVGPGILGGGESLVTSQQNSLRGSGDVKLPSIHESEGLIPGLDPWVKIPHCCGCGVGRQLQL